jgi:anti-anti-sigma factor
VVTQRFFLRGDVDVASAPDLRAELDDLVRTSDGDIVLDCGGLTFIDSAGVAVLLRTRKALDARGNELRVANVDGVAARVLDVLGLNDVLHVNEPTGPSTTNLAT